MRTQNIKTVACRHEKVACRHNHVNIIIEIDRTCMMKLRIGLIGSDGSDILLIKEKYKFHSKFFSN